MRSSDFINKQQSAVRSIQGENQQNKLHLLPKSKFSDSSEIIEYITSPYYFASLGGHVRDWVFEISRECTHQWAITTFSDNVNFYESERYTLWHLPSLTKIKSLDDSWTGFQSNPLLQFSSNLDPVFKLPLLETAIYACGYGTKRINYTQELLWTEADRKGILWSWTHELSVYFSFSVTKELISIIVEYTLPCNPFTLSYSSPNTSDIANTCWCG